MFFCLFSNTALRSRLFPVDLFLLGLIPFYLFIYYRYIYMLFVLSARSSFCDLLELCMSVLSVQHQFTGIRRGGRLGLGACICLIEMIPGVHLFYFIFLH